MISYASIIGKLELLWNQKLDERGRAYFVEKPTGGRRLAITDIHGCFETFVALIAKVDLKKEDQLFILGDMVDRGPYSLMVIAYIWQLIDHGYSIFCLRGNHEQLFLSLNRENLREMPPFAQRQYAAHLLRSDGSLRPELDAFFASLPIFYETDAHLLVHAGFDTTVKKPFQAWKDMMWTRNFVYDLAKLKSKTVIHGHVPSPLTQIERAVASGSKDINLDNGCVRARVPEFGQLVCLNMDSRELTLQKNLDLNPLKLRPSVHANSHQWE